MVLSRTVGKPDHGGCYDHGYMRDHLGWRIRRQELAPKVSEIESLRADVKKIQDYLLKQAADEGDRFKDLYLAERENGNLDTTKGGAL